MSQQPMKIQMIHPKPMLTLGFYAEYQKKILNEYKYDNKLIDAYAFYEPSTSSFLRFEDFSFDIKSNPQNTGKLYHIKGTIAHYSTIDSFNALDNIDKVISNAKDSESAFILFIFGDLKTFVFQFKFFYANDEIEYKIRKVSKQLTIENKAHLSVYEKEIEKEEVNVAAWFKVTEDIYALNDISTDMSSIPIWIKNVLYSFASDDEDDTKEKTIILNKQKKEVLQLTLGNIKKSSSNAQAALIDLYKKENSMKVDLKQMLNPESIAESAIDLNINLMKWRMCPDLDTDVIRKSNYLLIGAGTLGCHVARCLLGWGARNITFIDNGRVSYSNPVRQSLYTFTDSTTENYKAILGAKKLREIFPLANAEGFNFQIPLPGRALVNEDARTNYFVNLKQLHDQIAKCDVLFLLTDSRESRWYPTVIASALNKTVITAAIGFDSYLVMRHGTSKDNLGCYFCTDIITPTDTSGSRTLDQQCTISRPGVSMICSGLAIELAMSLMNKGLNKDEYTIPHQLRGNLLDYSLQHFHHFANRNCVACSKNITSQYQSNFETFAINVMNDQYYIEKTCGIDELIKNIKLDAGEEKDDF